MTVDGSWKMTVGPENVQFTNKVHTPTRFSPGKAQIGADSKATMLVVAPSDYGEVQTFMLPSAARMWPRPSSG